MTAAAISLDYLLNYFVFQLLLPLILFLVLIYCFWYLQSRLVLYVYYQLVLPQLRKNKFLYWAIGAPAVASHELLGHALTSAVTGSSPSLHKPIHPEKSAVRIRSKRTAMGYLSSILATIAPCFAPPLILITIFYFVYPNTLLFGGGTLQALLNNTLNNLAQFLTAVFNYNLLLPLNALFFYLVAIMSLTAGASKTDFRVVLGQTKKHWYFALFIVLASALGIELARIGMNYQTGLQVFYPIAGAMLLSLAVVLTGLLLMLAFAFYLKRMQEFNRWLKLLCFLSAPAAYYAIINTGTYFKVLPRFTEALVLSLLFALALQSSIKLFFKLVSLLSRKQ